MATQPLTISQQKALGVLIDYYGYGRGLTGMRLDNLLYWKYVNMRQLRGLERRGYIAIDTAANWVEVGAALKAVQHDTKRPHYKMRLSRRRGVSSTYGMMKARRLDS